MRKILAALAATLLSLGLLAAPAAAGPAPKADARLTAPKGAPPAPTAKAAKAALACPCYFYNAGEESLVRTGIYSTSYIGNPTVAAGDYHSLGELSLTEKAGTGLGNTVEIGWSKDPGLYGDSNVHLFSYWWKNGVGQGYNAVAGYVDNASNPVNIGSVLTTGVAKKFGIEFTSGVWWVYYDTAYVGYYPETNWTGSLGGAPVVGGFHQSDKLQAFGEVAAGSTTPTTDMGTGSLGTVGSGTPAPSRWSATSYVPISSPLPVQTYFNQPSVPTKYTWGPVAGAGSTRTFYWGGPGW